MLEIFIPTKIKDSIIINTIDPKFKEILSDNFWVLWIDFREGFFEWIHWIAKDFSLDIIIACNWAFWSRYFVDYDWQKDSICSLWQYFFDSEILGGEINSIAKNYEEIVSILSSYSLLTNSSKQEIIDKIGSSLFLISWIAFMLQNLLNKTQENIRDLDTIANSKDEKVEYRASASVLIESPKTNEAELKSQIDILNLRAWEFIELSNKFLIK